ncbi:MAG: ATP-binding protein [Saprospiraceae bacterium]
MNLSLKSTLLFYILVLPFLVNGQDEKYIYPWSDFPADASIEQLEAFGSIYETDTTISLDLEQRRAFFKKGFDAAKHLKVKSDIVGYAQKLSNNYCEIDSFSQAIYYARQIIDTNYDTISIARGYNSLGYIYLIIGDYNNSLTAFFQSIKYAKLLNNGWESYPIGNIVTVYKNLEDYDNAIKYTRRSIEIDKKATSPDKEYGLVYNYTYLVMLFQKKNEPDSSAKYIDLINQNITALDTLQQIIYKNVRNFAYTTIADYYIANNDLELAKNYIDMGRALVNTNPNFTRERILFSEGQYWLKKENYSEVKRIIQQFESINLHSFTSIENFLKLKIDYYRAINDFKNVAAVQAELMEEQKEKFSDDRLRYSSFANTEFKSLEQQQQIEKLENQKRLAELRYRNRNIITLIVLSALLILGVLMYRWNKQKEVYSKELEYKNEQLQGMDAAKTRFFTNISHELKTPLTLIINPLQKVLKTKTLDEESRYLVQSASKNSLHLFDLVYQILDLIKFENNKVDVKTTSIHLMKHVHKIYADFETYAISRNIDFQLKHNITEDLYIEIDQYKFTTVIKNLVSNAIKFTADGGEVRISVEDKINQLQIKVFDTGRGIHVNDLPHVFDRYYQSKISGDIMEGGTGIGLAICKEYVELMGGSIQVKSTFGQGSTFMVNLPKVIATPSGFINDSIGQNETTTSTSTPTLTLQNKNLGTVLVVEDNLNMQEYIGVILKPNYNVVTALHGKAALEVLNSDVAIDLIISDLMMPEMNGYELITQLKNTPKFATIPIIMLTAMSGTDEKLKALRIGIDDYIVKPFVDEELLARIDNLIDFSESRKVYKQELATTERTVDTEDTTSVELTKEELEWLAKFEKIVKKNYQNSNFKIDSFTEELMTNRSKLYQNVKQFTGLTPRNYINEVRFRAARELIENKPNLTIKAIAYKVGFKDEKYFSRNFKKRFGKYPSEFLK